MSTATLPTTRDYSDIRLASSEVNRIGGILYALGNRWAAWSRPEIERRAIMQLLERLNRHLDIAEESPTSAVTAMKLVQEARARVTVLQRQARVDSWEARQMDGACPSARKRRALAILTAMGVSGRVEVSGRIVTVSFSPGWYEPAAIGAAVEALKGSGWLRLGWQTHAKFTGSEYQFTDVR